MTLDEIVANLESYISKHTRVIKALKRYRAYAENQVGIHHKDKIIRSLRLNDELTHYIGDNGALYLRQNNRLVPLEGLTIEDVIIEETLPKSSLETLKTYSIGEKPFIDFEDNDWIKDFEEREEIHSKIKELVDEMLTTGDSFYKIENIGGCSQITILYKEEVIVVPDSFNSSRVGAYIYFTVKETVDPLTVSKVNYNYVEIYMPDGKIYIYTNKDKKEEYSRVKTMKCEDVNIGLGEFSLHHIRGLSRVKNNLYSHSIFKGLGTSLTELVVRKTSNAFLFNKVNNPTLLIGGSSYTAINTETGEKEAKISGKAIPFDEPTEATATRYLEPPTSHTPSIYQHIEFILDDVYKQLGVNEISLGISQDGNIASGEAFKKAITPTLNKCRDIVNCLRKPLTKMYEQAYYIENKEKISITIKFKDGISLSEKENIENKSSLINNKILSRTSILIEMGFTEEEAKKELKRIADEDKLLNPVFEMIDIPSGRTDE
ncbi:MAG: hypothetical protein RR795_01270 [Cetobacterium sp.]|uniref:hypothetical protein n=2 Tax=Cetobacterium sp. TaxID=2071632 RepID=UPI002FC7B6F1